MQHLGEAAQLQPSERYCTCCERPLKRSFAWLEGDTRGGYFDGGVEPARSQGWFPFGLTCAKRHIAEGGKRDLQRR